MAKTFENYLTNCQNEVDDTSNSAKTVLASQITETYAEIMRQVGQYVQSSVTEDSTAVIDQTAYPVSQSASVIHQVAYKPQGGTNFMVLSQISLEDYKDNFINRPSSSPTNYFMDGDVVNIAPAPNDTGTVRRVYTPTLTDLTAGVTAILPDRFSRVLVTGVVARFKAWENNLSASQYYQGLYQNALRDCILDLSKQTKVMTPKLYGQNG